MSLTHVELIECIKTWQGEGPDSGQKMLLLRFPKCNLNCSFCDTRIKMNNCIPGEYSNERIKKISEDNNLGLMITGGEPTIFNEVVAFFLNNIKYPVANIETNGFKLPELCQMISIDKPVKYIYSPKFITNKSCNDNINMIDWLKEANRQGYPVYIKLVIGLNDDENSETYRYLAQVSEFYPKEKIFLMPLGTSIIEMRQSAENLFGLAEKFGVNITSRTHLVFDFV